MSKQLVLETIVSLVKANFSLTVLSSIVIAGLALTDSPLLFEDSAEFADLYGPLANNLRLILVYFGLAQVNIYFYCQMQRRLHFLAVVGIFYLSIIGGLAAYGEVNQIPVDSLYYVFFAYQSISHILFGGIYLLPLLRKRSKRP
jgi:hypothetical protein